jgi:antitoxin (DNA-binding transcriptional repressor) of toxin-antitoxin stability system
MTYTLSVAEAAAQLSELVQRLQASDTVVLLERGVPVAKLSAFAQMLPQSGNSAMTLAEEWLRLFEEIRALPHSATITDEDIQAEIDAYRRGE